MSGVIFERRPWSRAAIQELADRSPRVFMNGKPILVRADTDTGWLLIEPGSPTDIRYDRWNNPEGEAP